MKTPAELRAAIQAAIGRELRQIHADIIDEGVPDRFAEILRQLNDPSNDESRT